MASLALPQNETSKSYTGWGEQSVIIENIMVHTGYCNTQKVDVVSPTAHTKARHYSATKGCLHVETLKVERGALLRITLLITRAMKVKLSNKTTCRSQSSILSRETETTSMSLEMCFHI